MKIFNGEEKTPATNYKLCRVVPCVEKCDWITVDDDNDIFPEGWAYWDCDVVTVGEEDS